MIRRPPRSTLFPTRRSSDLVCRFRPSRPRIDDHRLEHLGCGDHQLSRLVGLLDDLFLIDGDEFDAGFHAQITARHHDPIGGRDDFIEMKSSRPPMGAWWRAVIWAWKPASNSSPSIRNKSSSRPTRRESW